MVCCDSVRFAAGTVFRFVELDAARLPFNVRWSESLNVHVEPPANADAGSPRKDDEGFGLERRDGGCRSRSA